MIAVTGSESKGIVVYPNPFRRNVTVKVDRQDIGKTWHLVNAQGIELRQIELKDENTQIDLNNLAPGLYLLRRDSDVVLKLIKE